MTKATARGSMTCERRFRLIASTFPCLFRSFRLSSGRISSGVLWNCISFGAGPPRRLAERYGVTARRIQQSLQHWASRPWHEDTFR